MANIYDVEGIEEFLPEQKKPLSSFLGDYATTAQEVASPYIGMSNKYGFGADPAKIQGLGSDVRHTTGSALGKFGIQDYFSQFGLDPNSGLSNFIGNTGIAGSTVVQEIGDAIRGFRQAGLEGAINQPMEDAKANFRAMGIPYGTSLEDIVNMSVKGSPSAYMANVPEEVKISRFNAPGPFNYGTAEASDLPINSLERDFPGMSTGDIIESMNNRPQNLGFIEEAPQVKGMSYEQMVDLGLAGPDQDVGMTAEDLQNRPGFLGSIQNKIGSGLGSLKDFAIDKGRMGRNLIGSAGAMALGLPGIVGSGAMTLLSGLGNMFEDRQISGDGTIMDEFGRSYTADELNKQNALGGYYTDAARSSRRRTSRIAKMLERQKLGKKISAKNLAKLQAQEAAQEAARQAATTQMAAANKAAGRGGYQAGYGGDFMGGGGRGRGMGAADKGGSDSMGSFRDGGLASMFTRRG